MKKNVIFIFALVVFVVMAHQGHSAITSLFDSESSVSGNQPMLKSPARAAQQDNQGRWCYANHLDSCTSCDESYYTTLINVSPDGTASNTIKISEEGDTQDLDYPPFDDYKCCAYVDGHGAIFAGCQKEANGSEYPVKEGVFDSNDPHLSAPNCLGPSSDCYVSNNYNVYGIKTTIYECKDSYTVSSTVDIPDRNCCYFNNDANYLCEPSTAGTCLEKFGGEYENLTNTSGTPVTCGNRVLGYFGDRFKCLGGAAELDYCVFAGEEDAKKYLPCKQEFLGQQQDIRDASVTFTEAEINIYDDNEGPHGICYDENLVNEFVAYYSYYIEPDREGNPYGDIYCNNNEEKTAGWQAGYIEGAEDYCVDKVTKKAYSKTSEEVPQCSDVFDPAKLADAQQVSCDFNASLTLTKQTCLLYGSETLFCTFANETAAQDYLPCEDFFSAEDLAEDTHNEVQDYNRCDGGPGICGICYLKNLKGDFVARAANYTYSNKYNSSFNGYCADNVESDTSWTKGYKTGYAHYCIHKDTRIAYSSNDDSNGSCPTQIEPNVDIVRVENDPNGLVDGWYSTVTNRESSFTCINSRGENKTYYKQIDLKSPILYSSAIGHIFTLYKEKDLNALCYDITTDASVDTDERKLIYYKTDDDEKKAYSLYYVCKFDNALPLNTICRDNHSNIIDDTCVSSAATAQHTKIFSVDPNTDPEDVLDNLERQHLLVSTGVKCPTGTGLYTLDDWWKSNGVKYDFLERVTGEETKNLYTYGPNYCNYAGTVKNISTTPCKDCNPEKEKDEAQATSWHLGCVTLKEDYGLIIPEGSAPTGDPIYDTLKCWDNNEEKEKSFKICKSDFYEPYLGYDPKSGDDKCTFSNKDYYRYGGACPTPNEYTVVLNNYDPDEDYTAKYGSGITHTKCYNGGATDGVIICDPNSYTILPCEAPNSYLEGFEPTKNDKYCKIAPKGEILSEKTNTIYYHKDASIKCVLSYCDDKNDTEYEKTVVESSGECTKIYGTDAKFEACIESNGNIKNICYYKKGAYPWTTDNCGIGHILTGKYILIGGKKHYERCDCAASYVYHYQNCNTVLAGRSCEQNIDQTFIDKSANIIPYASKLIPGTTIKLYQSCSDPKTDPDFPGYGGNSGENNGAGSEGSGDAGEGNGDAGEGSGGAGEGSGGAGEGNGGTGEGSGDAGEGNGGAGEGNGGTGEGNDDAGEGSGDAGEGNDDAGEGNGGAGEGNGGAEESGIWAPCYYCCPTGTKASGNYKQTSSGRQFECVRI